MSEITTDFKIKRHDDTRKFTNFKSEENEYPKLQFQWVNEHLKCIGMSPVLKYKNNFDDLTWIPRHKSNNIELIKPNNAKYIMIWGNQPLYASKNDFSSSLKDNNFNEEYKPTIGINIIGPIFLNRPLRMIRAVFDLSTGYRLLKYSINDIVNEIIIKKDKFISVKLSEKFYKIKD